MNIYRIKTDSNNIQLLQATKEEYTKLSFRTFDCVSRLKNWEELEVYVYDPKTKPKNFYSWAGGILVFDEKVLDVCQTIFEMAGEILPLRLERSEQKLYVLNILQCRNGLDYDRTVWDYYDDGTKGRILDYKFHEWRIQDESTLFKIPESSVNIFCFTDDRNEDDQFYYLYHKHKLTGLIFEEIDNK
jgi:hypothetical protein